MVRQVDLLSNLLRADRLAMIVQHRRQRGRPAPIRGLLSKRNSADAMNRRRRRRDKTVTVQQPGRGGRAEGQQYWMNECEQLDLTPKVA